MNLRDLYMDWRRNKEPFVKASTISAYTLLCENHILNAYGNRSELTEYDLQSFVLNKINDGLSRKTVKDIMIVLKMIIKYGVRYNLWKEMPPFEHVQWPSQNYVAPIEVLNFQDYKKLVKYTEDNFTFRNLGILLSLSAGLRIGEVCALKFSDFDLHEKTVTISRTIQRVYTFDYKTDTRKTELIIDNPKTANSNRTIPLSAFLVKVLKALDKIVNQDHFVLTNDLTPTEPRTYRSYYKNLMKKLNMPSVKYHGLRHSFATQCIAAGVDVKTVSVLMGHANVSITFDLYVHPTGEQKSLAINKLFKSMK
ncbi:MAG TPA: site-specific integrase [Dysgonamonadaceae bacterium]|nr:site-specific integrase [Dysgonamonadaceae bacterium]